MRDFFKRRKFKLAIILLVLVLFISIMSALLINRLGVKIRIVEYLVLPFQKISVFVGEFFGSFVSDNSKNDLITENFELKSKLIDDNNLKNENDQLRSLLGIKDNSPNISFYKSFIISKDPVSRFGDFIIQGGRLNGIKNRSVVISNGFVLGIVTETYDYSSRVSTILNPDVNIGVYEIRTGSTGILSGDLEFYTDNKVKMDYIDNSDIVKGDIIVSSGNSDVFPKDLIIGTVDKVEKKSNSNSFYAVVDPSADIKNSVNIFVVTGF